MCSHAEDDIRIVSSVHGTRQVDPDPVFEMDLSRHLRDQCSRGALLEQYCRLADGEAELDSLMRRAIWRAVARRFGNRVRIGSGVCFKHLETFEIGDEVFVGAQTYVQGCFDAVDERCARVRYCLRRSSEVSSLAGWI
jgi:hypothetical protein